MHRSAPAPPTFKALDPRKFKDPELTAAGERRASVALNRLDTLWFNTGTLCNIGCANCYIESSPTNDRLVYLTVADIAEFLDEAEAVGRRCPAPSELHAEEGAAASVHLPRRQRAAAE